MNGPEHRAEAERLATAGLAVVAEIRAAQDEGRRDALGRQAMGIWAQGQLHATLALAAAVEYVTTGLEERIRRLEEADEYDGLADRLEALERAAGAP